MFASAVAVARAFPLYSKKTNSNKGAVSNSNAERTQVNVVVEFILVGSTEVLNEDDCLMLKRASDCVRTTARIVDTPCNEMNTDHFIKVSSLLLNYVNN